MNQDAPNIIASFCRGTWGESVGLTYKEGNDYVKAGEGVSYGQNGYMLTQEQCESSRLAYVAQLRKHSSSESVIKNQMFVVSLFNGIVPSAVTALNFYTTQFHCQKEFCQE